VVSYAVSLRTREIGIRMALGARAGRVVGRVAGKGLVLAGLGLVLGAAGALATTGLLRALLFGVEPSDPANLTLVGAVLLAVSGLAALLPALRASRVDPARTLRAE
jgi:ABC-type antimicrobial peptide transport system permease subunit